MPIKVNLLNTKLSSPQPQTSWYQQLFKNKSFFILSLTLLPLTFFTIFLAIPPKQPISPLSHAEQPDLVRQSLNQTKKPITYYLASSQDYLDKAKTLANTTKSSQTSSQKQQIVHLLNESLRSATSAIRHYPQTPQAYQQRAKVYQTIAHLDPQAQEKAQKDLAIAQQLSSGKTLQKLEIKPQDLVNTQPLKEASLTKNIAIAFPEEKTIKDTTTKESSNAKKGTATLPAGEKEITIKSTYVNSENLIYFTPEKDTQNEILSLSQKQTCQNKDSNCTPSFTLKLTNSLSFDLPIEWWIVE